MKLTNTDMVAQCMQRVQYWQAHCAAIEAACSALHTDRQHVRADVGNLRDLLIQRELEAWRDLAMWGLTLDDAERNRVKAAVHERFLRDGMHVAKWFSGGRDTGSWLAADDEAFRAMAREYFAPKP